jgi:TonB family protein
VGLYAKHKPFSPAQEEAVSRYMSVTIHQLEIEWGRHMPRVANDAWVKSATVVVRFAVMPDGTIDTPIVTASSGRKSYDDHALNAIQASTPFPPLPDGVTRAVPVCMRFGYNTDRSPKKFEPAELWPAPAKPAAPVNPSGSQPK